MTYIYLWISLELVQSCEVPIQHLNFLDTCRRLHAHDGGYLVRVGFDTPLSDQISQELFGGHSEGAFLKVEVDLILLETVERLAQVL